MPWMGKPSGIYYSVLGGRIRPYLQLARLDRPIGVSLLYLPCSWSIQMASFAALEHATDKLANPYMLCLFLIGATVMRGAGCTINDLWDRRIDARVERTKDRPLASGLMTQKQAIAFLGIQLTVGLAILTQLNVYCIALGSLSLLPVTIYPLMKRITYWPQAVLGLTFNWGALLGMPAVLGALHAEQWKIVLPLYLGGVCWTLVYDTIYAHQDKKDDVNIGVKSTAVLFGKSSPLVLTIFASMALALWNIAAYKNGHSWLFFSLLDPLAFYHFYWQIWKTNYDNPSDCLKKFKSNQYLGLAFFLVLLTDTLYKKYELLQEERRKLAQ